MASEQKRGCGYRKVGGLYLVGGGVGIPCDRLPYALDVCPCCGQGIKKARGWTWVDVGKLFQGSHYLNGNEIYPGKVLQPCECGRPAGAPGTIKIPCPLCQSPETMGKAGLLWIGEKFYKFPSQFIKEGVELGFSRRIKAIPHGFKIGTTWVLLAHKNTVLVDSHTAIDGKTDDEYKPGIFYVWLPQRVELIFKESDRGSEKVQAAEKRGLTPVFFPDDDVDHRGNVHDDFEREQKGE